MKDGDRILFERRKHWKRDSGGTEPFSKANKLLLSFSYMIHQKPNRNKRTTTITNSPNSSTSQETDAGNRLAFLRGGKRTQEAKRGRKHLPLQPTITTHRPPPTPGHRALIPTRLLHLPPRLPLRLNPPLHRLHNRKDLRGFRHELRPHSLPTRLKAHRVEQLRCRLQLVGFAAREGGPQRVLAGVQGAERFVQRADGIAAGRARGWREGRQGCVVGGGGQDGFGAGEEVRRCDGARDAGLAGGAVGHVLREFVRATAPRGEVSVEFVLRFREFLRAGFDFVFGGCEGGLGFAHLVRGFVGHGLVLRCVVGFEVLESGVECFLAGCEGCLCYGETSVGCFEEGGGFGHIAAKRVHGS